LKCIGDGNRQCVGKDMMDEVGNAAATKRAAVRSGLRKWSPDLLGL